MATRAWSSTGAEPFPLGVSCDLDATSTKDVRRRVRALLGDREDVVVQDAVLVADELISNAHRHGVGPRACRVAVLYQGRRLRIEVDDAAPALPRIRTPDRFGGRGLVLVGRLATAWGVQMHAHHKTVWAELLDHAGSGQARHLAVAPTGDR
jgi:two-component sensor histidine kinase